MGPNRVVGRESEQSAIEGFLIDAGHQFAVAALEGEAGIGKTTLWRAARERAEASGARLLWCRPSGAEAKFSFAAVADLLAKVPDAAWTDLPAPQREALEVALLRAPPGEREPAPHAVAAGFLGLIRSLAADRTLVIAVDDVQWLDPPSRGLLEFAARRLEAESIGLLYTLRLTTGRPGLERVISEDRLRRIALTPLSLAAMARIIADRLKRSLPRPLLVRIHQATGGNPFYALEMARLLIEQGAQQAGAALPVPDDLRDLATTRIRRLPAVTREALLMAAVVSAPDAGMVDLAALGPAEEAGIVNVIEGRIEFTHPLFASAMYASVSTARRRALHRRAAELVPAVEERAQHLALGSERPEASVARRLDEAAALARARGAPDAAADLAELAAFRTPPRSAAQRARRLLAAARLCMDAGDLARAERLVEEVLKDVSPGPERAVALQLSGQLRGRRRTFADAAGLASEALEAARGEHRLCAEIELDLGFFVVSLGDFRGAEAHARAALNHAEAAGDDGLLADALAGMTVIEFLGGRGLNEERMARALALEDPLRIRTFVMRPSCIHGMIQLWTGHVTEAGATLRALQAEVAERGQEGFAPLLSFYLVWASVWRGDLAGAVAIADEAVEACELLEDSMSTATSCAAAALAHAFCGPASRARAEAARALTVFGELLWRSGMIWPCWALGLAELSEANPVGADAVLGPLAEQLSQMGASDPVLGMFLPDEVEALISLGELEQAERHLTTFAQLAHARHRGWALAAAARCRGALAAARGDSRPAFEAFESALSGFAELGFPFERARTLMLAGQARRRFKQRGLARDALTEALSAFETMGATPWAERARSELARVGRRAATSEELTAGERQVAELVASGLSNREVAERAFLSVKTVEATLTRVYRKLGVRSRASLARTLPAEDTKVAGPLS